MDLLRVPSVRRYGLSYFDDSNAVAPSWAAHQLCNRCGAVKALLELSSREPKVCRDHVDCMAKSITLLDYAAEVEPTRVVPHLPLEIIDSIIGYVVLGLRDAKKRSRERGAGQSKENLKMVKAHTELERRATLQALLHTSVRIRWNVAKLFVLDLKLVESHCTPNMEVTFTTYAVNPALGAFSAEASSWRLRDMSLVCARSLAAPSYKGNAVRILTFPAAVELRWSEFTVKVSIQPSERNPYFFEKISHHTGTARRRVGNQTPPLTMMEACEVLIEALTAVSLPYEVNPYCRVSRSKEPFRVYATVTMELPELEHSEIWVLNTDVQTNCLKRSLVRA